MACSQTVGANLCQRHRVRENLSTDSKIIVYINKQKLCINIYTEKKKLVYMYMNLLLSSLYMVSFVLWLTGIPGPQEKEVS